MFLRNLISQLISTYEIDFGSFTKSRTEEVTTIRYAVITAMCDYFTDTEISKSTELCRSASTKFATLTSGGSDGGAKVRCLTRFER